LRSANGLAACRTLSDFLPSLRGASVTFSHESRQLGTWWDVANHLTGFTHGLLLPTSRDRNDEVLESILGV
jgi:hypothetical protein